MDITYIPMARGFTYLAAVLDWFTRRVLSWRVSITLEVDFCIEAVEEALARHGRLEAIRSLKLYIARKSSPPLRVARNRSTKLKLLFDC
jgi:transposase InsO family protein